MMYQSASRSVVISQCNGRLGQIRKSSAGEVSPQRTLDHGPKVSSSCLTMAIFTPFPPQETFPCNDNANSSPLPRSRRNHVLALDDGRVRNPVPDETARTQVFRVATSVRRDGIDRPPCVGPHPYKE